MSAEAVVLSEETERGILDLRVLLPHCDTDVCVCRDELVTAARALVRAAVSEDRRQREAEKVCDFAMLCAFDLLADVEDQPSIETLDEWREAVSNRIRSVAAEATRVKDATHETLMLALRQEKDTSIAKLQGVLEMANKTAERRGARIAELEAEVEWLEEEGNELNTHLQDASAEVEGAKVLIAKLEADLAAARKAIEEARELMSRTIDLEAEAQCPCTIAQRESGHRIDCWAPEFDMFAEELRAWLSAHGPKAQEVGHV